jgi:hypothetical protein
MRPCEINAAIAGITNYLYCRLSRKNFLNLGIFLSLLSKDILAMATIEELCIIEEKIEKKHEKK